MADPRKLKDEAAKAVERGKYRKAADLYVEVSLSEPDDPLWPHRAGEQFKRAGVAPEAIRFLSAAAEGYVRQGFLLKAISVAKMILEVDPRRTETQAMLASLYARREGAAAPRPTAPAVDRPLVGRSVGGGGALELESADGPLPAGGARRPPPTPSSPSLRPPPPRAPEPPAPLALDLDLGPGPQPARRPAPPPPAPVSDAVIPIVLDLGAAPPPARAAPPPRLAEPAAPQGGDSTIPIVLELPEDLNDGAPPARAPAPAPGPRAAREPAFDPFADLDDAPVRPAPAPPPPVAAARRPTAPPRPIPSGDEFSDFDDPSTAPLPPPAPRPAPTPARAARATSTIDEFSDFDDPSVSAARPPPRAAPPPPAGPAGIDAETDFSGLDLLDAPAPVVVPDPTALLAHSSPIADVPLKQVIPGARITQDFGVPAFEIPLAQDSADPSPPKLPYVPLFSSLDEARLSHLIAQSRIVRFNPGETIVKQGAVGRSLFVLVRGEVEVYLEGVGPPVADLGEGAFFGELAVLTDMKRSASVVAVDEVELLEIDRDDIRDLVADEPAVLQLLLRFFRERLIERLITTSQLFAQFSGDDARTLTERFQLLELEPGAVIIREGQRSDGLFILLLGECVVSQIESGPIATIGPGDACGEMSLLTGQPAMATVHARTRAWLLALPRTVFQELISTHPQLLIYINDLAESRRAQVAERLSMF